MITLRTKDITRSIKEIGEFIKAGERVLVVRPHNENLVILSEDEYKNYEKIQKDFGAMAQELENTKRNMTEKITEA